MTLRRLVVLAIAAWSVSPAAQTPVTRPASFSVVEATIPDMQRAMAQRRVTSRELVTQYLTRIALHEKRINSAISINPRALEDADARDAERARGRVRGPLHGIPIALKDNIHTIDMITTGGALAFANFLPPYDATLTKNLRDAGAVIIAKTVLTELANWVAGAPTPMPGNYTAVAGFAFNPYDPRPDPRQNTDGRPVLSTGGSSSGAGTAANFWAANVGTDTAGSIVNPAMLTMLVGIRPTTGRISRYGIMPITADQDTAGPMARTVTDAAILLGAIESASPDPNDSATTRCAPPPGRDYTRFLKPDGLRGARIGIPRAFYYDRLVTAGEPAPPAPPAEGRGGRGGGGRGGLNEAQARLMAEAIDVLKRGGAIVVDPANMPSVLDPDPQKNPTLIPICSGTENAKGKDAACSVVLKYGMKRDFNAYLATLGAAAPVKSLTELRTFNTEHARANAIRYGQSNLDISDEIDLVQDRARYDADRARDIALAGDRGFKAAIDEHRLDALMFPGWNISNLAARPGYPEIVVPLGVVPAGAGGGNPLPPGFDPKPSPYSAAFVGLACSEPRLIEIAYAFEQATKRRVPPPMPK
ncbi:MAG TPA: amidase family protein [Vicinamibacterales bacterium]|nr:amidase family protein [Vicinamibacterales bacterium]